MFHELLDYKFTNALCYPVVCSCVVWELMPTARGLVRCNPGTDVDHVHQILDAELVGNLHPAM